MAPPEGLYNQQQTQNLANNKVAQYVLFHLPQTRQQLGDGYSLPVHPQWEKSANQWKLKQTFNPTTHLLPTQCHQPSSQRLMSFVLNMFGS